MPETTTPARDAAPAASIPTPRADLPPPPRREPEPQGLSATFSALRERDFAWYFAGNIAFFMAMQMQMLLRGFLAFELTDAASALGYMAAMMAVPMLIAAPFGGVVADRVNKRFLLIVTQTSAAAMSLLIGLLILFDMIAFWHLLVISLITGIIFSFNMPARQALVPQLVPQHKLMNAISLQLAGMNATRILAPAIAGALIAPFGVGLVYMLTFAMFVLAVASEFHLPQHGMKAVRDAKPLRRALREDLGEGFKYIWHNPLIRSLMLLGLAFPLFGFPLQQMLPVFAKDVFDVGPSGLGILSVSTGIGGLIGALAAANMDRIPRKGLLMFIGGIWMGGMYVAFTQSPGFIPALVFLGLGNIGGMIFQTTNNTVIQSSIPAELRGRVMSVMMMSFGLMPLGVLPVTQAADHFGARTAVAISSGLLVVMMLLFFMGSRRLRTLRLNQLAHVEYSPAQAAKLIAEGKISQKEADRLTGETARVRGEEAPAPAGRPVAQRPPADLRPAHQSPDPRPGSLSLPVAPAAQAAMTTQPSPGRLRDPDPPPLIAAVDPPRPSGYGQPGAAERLWWRWRRPAVLTSAFGVGMVLGFGATTSGELLRAARIWIAGRLDPDN